MKGWMLRVLPLSHAVQDTRNKFLYDSAVNESIKGSGMYSTASSASAVGALYM